MEVHRNSRTELLTDFQLQVEHALDMQDRDLVLFVDASVSCREPFEFARLEPAADASYTTHAISPAAVLEVYQRVIGNEPPPAFVLSIRGHGFELGDELSGRAAQHLSAALELGEQLFHEPSLSSWLRFCGAT